MCGIAGIWKFTRPIDATDIEETRQMSAALVHRGPDGEGAWSDNRLALRHRRLSIIDPTDNGLQPMATQDGKGVIAYNGEVYNYLDIRRELTAQGVPFFSDTDTEVVLNALHFWGVEKALQRFNGMFAFAYYDLRSGVMWIARDRAGIKSMSLLKTGDRLLFASEDKGILGARSVHAPVSARSITLFLAVQYIDSRLSMFDKIERIQPGGLWRIDSSGIRKGQYWNALDAINVNQLASKPRHPSIEKAELDAHIRKSLSLHLVSDVPIASTCSSGVDSGTLTALMAAQMDKTRAYVVDPVEGVSEYSGARRTAEHIGAELQPVPITREDYLRQLPKTIFDLESGMTNISSVAKSIMIQKCKADGIKVLLTGEGADELFGGYGWHYYSARRHRFTGHPLAKLLFPKWNSRRQERLLNAPFTVSPGAGDTKMRHLFSTALWPEHSFFQADIMERLSPLRSPFERVYAGAGIFDFHFHMQDIIHRHDRIAMAGSVELRVPYLENSLIDYALNLSPSFKYRSGQTKWLLKKVAESYLPKKNIYAEKKGFPVSATHINGLEKLLRGRHLADVLGWSQAENENIMAMIRDKPNFLVRLVTMELLVRIYDDGQSTEQLGEELVAMAR